MKILVRLPNWLGDMVMASALLEELARLYPQATISVIAKKGIDGLLPYLPGVHQSYIFSKEQYKGLKGLWQFGRSIRRKEGFDLFISLPDSFSSAFMGYATGATERVGYKKELRNALLTTSYLKPAGLHRVEEYLQLARLYAGKEGGEPAVRLQHDLSKKDHVVVNINSEASSRRLTASKAVEILSALRQSIAHPIKLIGAPKEQAFIEMVLGLLPNARKIESLAGKTSLTGLIEVLAGARVMLTTDSGPAHLANALGTHTVVLFGAGNENNTAPWNADKRTIIRLGKLTCEPCVRNECVQFDTPQCLELLETSAIVEAVQNVLDHG